MSVRLLMALGVALTLTACDNAAPGVSAPDQPVEPATRLVSGTTAVEHAFVPTIDPATMTDADIARVVPTARRCTFKYTEDSDPVLATDGARGVVKINGDLVALNRGAGRQPRRRRRADGRGPALDRAAAAGRGRARGDPTLRGRERSGPARRLSRLLQLRRLIG